MDINQDTLNWIRGLIIFNICGREYCADIKNLSTVFKANDSRFKEGNRSDNEVYYEGQLYKLIDINTVLKMPLSEITDNSRLILFEIFGKMFGFIADQIIEIITTDLIFQEKFLDLIPATNEEYIKGELLFQNRKILFPDYERISKELSTLKKFTFNVNQFAKINS